MGIFDVFSSIGRNSEVNDLKFDIKHPLKSKRQLDAIAEYIMTNYHKPKVSIEASYVDNPDEQLNLTDSKYGGLPYWDLSMDYPTNSRGEKLVLLAQINFEAEDIDIDMLPKEGMLQFFVESDKAYQGSRSYSHKKPNPTSQDHFRVIYHKSIDESVTAEAVRALGVKANTDLDETCERFPFYDAYSLEFSVENDYLTYSTDAQTKLFEQALRSAYRMVYQQEWVEFDGYDFFSSKAYDYLLDELVVNACDQMFGYLDCPFDDERKLGSKYDTMLLDFGVFVEPDYGADTLYFYINSEDLKKLDFSSIYYCTENIDEEIEKELRENNVY